MITFFVPGVPTSQGSKRIVGGRRGRGTLRVVEATKGLRAWRRAAAEMAMVVRKGRCFDEPVWLALTFLLPRPRKPRWEVPASAPDLDKLVRAIGDALVVGGLLANDARIVRFASPDGVYATGKYYTASATPEPGCIVRLGAMHERAPKETA